MSAAWQTVGTIASTAGVTTFAIGGAKGILAGYRTYASPYTCLTESERRLEKVRTLLQRLSPKRREEIEIATRSESSNCSSLVILENQLVDLTNMHCKLSKKIEGSTFTERHSPYSQFRANLSRFEDLAKELLNDTLKTTVPCIDDIVFPENSKRATEGPSSSESTFNPENSRRAVERPSNSESTFNPDNSRRAMEISSSSKSTSNPENSSWAMKVLSSSGSRESWNTPRESFSGPYGISPEHMV